MKDVYIEQLTWLRGIAALLVIITHSVAATEVSYTPLDRPAFFLPFKMLDLGSFGVTLFFALSGLTLFISNSTLQKDRAVIGFFIKRVLRVWPAFLVSLIVYIGFNELFSANYGVSQGHWIEFHLLDYNALNIVQYLAFVFNITGPPHLFNGAYWSLPVEFQYYLLFPMALFLMKRFGAVSLIVIGGGLYIIGMMKWIPMSDQSVFTFAYSFFGGMLVGIMYSRYSIRINRYISAALLIALLFVLSIIRLKYGALPSNVWNYYNVAAIVTVFIVMHSDFSYLPHKIRDGMRRYGEISYSTYLFHQLFIASCVLLIIKLDITGTSKLFLTLIITVIATYYCSRFTYHFIEKPFIRLSHRLNHKFNFV